MMIEVFKTNIQTEKEARQIATELAKKMNGIIIHFDLEDCDKILRVAGTTVSKNHLIIRHLQQWGYWCEILD